MLLFFFFFFLPAFVSLPKEFNSQADAQANLAINLPGSNQSCAFTFSPCDRVLTVYDLFSAGQIYEEQAGSY